MTYKRQFPLTYLWPFVITIVTFAAIPCAIGADDAAWCPAGCSCSPVDGFVNSRAVQCSYHDLSDIPTMLNSFTVHTLDLSNNEIRTLRNASFSNYSSLSTLILSHIKVEEIEINSFAGLQKMREIDLSYNELKSFNPEIFSSNPVLEKVILKKNNLVYLSSDFPILISNSISFLDLSFCFITKIHSVTFSKLPSLYSLDLSSNSLQTISLDTLENVPDLRVLELSNNRWTCNCDIVEVMQWTELRMEQQPAHKPVKCLEGQQYRELWTVAGGNRSCSESKTTEPVVARDREFTIDMEVILPIMSADFVLLPNHSPDTTLQRVIENAIKNETEIGPAPESETGDWALSWNVNTLMVFVILPISLGVAVLVSLIAVNYITKRIRVHLPLHHTQGEASHVTACSDFAVPLLRRQLTANFTSQGPEYVNRNGDGFRNDEYHLYEHIE